MATKVKFYTDLGLQSGTDAQIDGDLTITGDLTVQGTNTVVNSTTTSVTDNLFELANSNTSSDLLDIGIYGNYDDGLSDGGASEYTGLFRDASDSTWKLFDGLEVAPGNTVNTSGTGYAKAGLEVGDLTATTGDFSGTLEIEGKIQANNHNAIQLSGYGSLGQTGSGQMTILGHNARVHSDNNKVEAINSSWYASFIKQYYNQGISFHTTSSTVTGGDVLLDGTGANTHERMRIDNNGHVIIGGEEIPSTVLDGTGAAGALGIGNSSELYPAIALMSSARNWIVYQNTPGNFNIYDSTENKERMSIGNDGAVTLSPTTSGDNYGFEVITGSSADTGIKVGRTGAGNAMFGLAVVSNGTSSIGRIQFDGDGDVSFSDAANIELRDGLNVRIQQAFSNPTYATNRAVYAEDQGELGYNASVRASKTNIADVGDVSWLYNLNAKTFNKRKKIQGEKQSDGTYSFSYSDTEHSGVTEYGFIAEDLEALAPELCFYGYTRDVDADGNELDTFTKGELQGIHYESMVAPMLKLIQNQKDEIDALEARIATLESA